MKQTIIRLTENDLHEIIKEGVNQVLNEIGDSCRNPHNFFDAADAMDKRGHKDNAAILRKKGHDLYHKNGNDTFIGDTINNVDRAFGNEWLTKNFYHPKNED